MSDGDFIKMAKKLNEDTLTAMRTIRTSHPEMTRQEVLRHWLQLLKDQQREWPPSYTHYLGQFIDQHWDEAEPTSHDRRTT